MASDSESKRGGKSEGDTNDDMNVDDLYFNCRMYAKEYPDQGDVVTARVVEVTLQGIYVDLLEYDDMRAVVPLKEVTRKRITKATLHKHLKEGRDYAFEVIKVDPVKRYVDLSRKGVYESEKDVSRLRYRSAKSCRNVLIRAAIRHGGRLASTRDAREDPRDYSQYLLHVYEQVGWKLAPASDFRDALEFLTLVGNCADTEKAKDMLKNHEDLEGLDEVLLKDMVIACKTCLKVAPTTVRAVVAVQCHTKEGVDAIKKALLAGAVVAKEVVEKIRLDEDTAADVSDIRIALVSSPNFSITCQTIKPAVAAECLSEVMAAIEKSIVAQGGLYAAVEVPGDD